MAERSETAEPTRVMSRQEFAGIAARIAERSSKWSGDSIADLREGRIQAPMPRADALRFLADIREPLSWIEDECNG
jgi:Na+-translocating ferredoxin:NAD+ oxidoreductase RnfG subunit